MSVKKLKGIIGSLARSQGFYGRLYRDIDDSKSWAKLAKIMRNRKITTSLDVVYFFEC